MKNELLKTYASYFVSYLLAKVGDFSNVDSIILFGSVARGDAEKNSDVDIFIDIRKKTKKIEQEIKKIERDFYKSREAVLFKAKGIDRKINIIVGRIDEWPDLKKSIENEGIIFYGPYMPAGTEGKKYVIFFWDKIGKNRGAFLNKIYGFKVGEKKYLGLIEEFSGRKIGKSSIMIPIEHSKIIEDLLRKYKVDARIVEVYA